MLKKIDNFEDLEFLIYNLMGCTYYGNKIFYNNLEVKGVDFYKVVKINHIAFGHFLHEVSTATKKDKIKYIKRHNIIDLENISVKRNYFCELQNNPGNLVKLYTIGYIKKFQDFEKFEEADDYISQKLLFKLKLKDNNLDFNMQNLDLNKINEVK